jgi:hypothetical protein
VEPRILFLDIETRLFEAYTFGIRDQHITHKQLKNADDARNIHCVGLKWRGEKKVRVPNEWENGYRGMLETVHEALCEADAVATYNGASFDIPKLWGQFAVARMAPPPPPTQIDIFKAARKLGFISSKLDYIAPVLGLGGKVKHPGLEMWIAAKEGCEKSRKRMLKYCAGDVRLTEDVYDALLPYIPNHPRLRSGSVCPCGSDNTQHRGFNYSRHFKKQRIFCLDCRGWSAGQRTAAA